MKKTGKKLTTAKMIRKRLLALLLICCTLVGLSPVTAEAKLTYMSDLPRDGFVNYSDDAITTPVAPPSDGVKDPIDDPLQKPLEPAGA